MASIISGLSLLIIVLINGCFTLPITEIQFPEFTTTSFYDGFTTENNFNVRTLSDDDVFTTPFTTIEQVENNPTDFKRSFSEALNFDMSTATDASRQERIIEEPSTFVDTTERSFESKRSVEESSTFVDTTERSFDPKRSIEEASPIVDTTEQSFEQKRSVEEPLASTDSLPHEHETLHQKRVFIDEMSERGLDETTNDNEILSKFTTISMPLFTSTPSVIAPEVHPHKSIELTSTQKYVGSLVDGEEDNEEQKHHDDDEFKGSKKTGKKVAKVEEPVDEDHREEEEEHDEKVADKDEKTNSKHKQTKSNSKTSEDSSLDEKYLVGELYDQDSSKSRPTLPSNYAILDESVIPVTAEVVRSSSRKSKVSKEDIKLNQGEKSS